jgi:hypothetical protein
MASAVGFVVAHPGSLPALPTIPRHTWRRCGLGWRPALEHLALLDYELLIYVE